MLMCFLVMNSERNPAEDQLKSERIKCWYNFIKVPRSFLPVCTIQFYNFSASAQHIEAICPNPFRASFGCIRKSWSCQTLSNEYKFSHTKFLLPFSDSGKTSLYFPLKIPNRELARFERTSEHNEESRLLSHNMKFMSRKSSFDWLWKGALGKVEGGPEENNRRVESSNGKSTSRNNDFSFMY